MRIGVVVNPIAGMGGRVGLKGTDGKVAEARDRGAERRAPERAVDALSALYDRSPDSELLTYGGEMGAEEARAAGFDPEIVGEPGEKETSAADTREAVRRLIARRRRPAPVRRRGRNRRGRGRDAGRVRG